jgi:hypothetical protein
LEGKWSHRSGDGSSVKVCTNHVSMMAHGLRDKRREIVKKRTHEGDDDVWVIVLSFHLVSSVVSRGREQLGIIPLFTVSLWGGCLFGSTVCDMAQLGRKKGKSS